MSESPTDPAAAADAAPAAQSAVTPSDEAAPAVDAASDSAPAQPATDFSRLPTHARSLLQISVPVSVVLATQRKPIQEIVELVPGAIIKFDKSCQELLDLTVGDQRVAEGEVVKVGERFGLRISSMVLPQEHFVPLAG